MLRPERMSRVSVTGSRPVMETTIETVHDLNLVHVSEYDGAWEGFQPGDPIEGADDAAQKLVTVRALKSTLDVSEDDAGGPTRLVTDDALDEELEEIRQEVNELDDRRDDVRDELRSVEERIDAVEPFVELGIDLDLLSGYDSLSVAVGEGDADAIKRALIDADEVAASEVFDSDGAVAVFVYPDESAVDDEGDFAVQDLLVGVSFQAVEIPDAEGSPEEYVSELEHRKQQLESKLATVENELEEARVDVGGFLLAAEEKLAIEVQKREAPLSFATTDNAFVAEGWIPTDRFVDLAEALETTVGDRVDIEELERAEYDSDGHAASHESLERSDVGGEPAAADGGRAAGGDYAASDDGERETATDGGTVTMGDDDPPVLQNNPRGVQPFELLTKAVGRPNYSELDPTIILFLTFPVMFGFMIGDVGYGAIYTAIGYYVYRNFESETFRNFGIVAAAAGLSTLVFGILYGEIFGLHLVTEYLWAPIMGHPPIEKGLSPATAYWARAWFVVTALFGLLHLNVGYVFEFVENNALHGFKEAVLETGSWLLALNGLWLFIFTRPPTSIQGGETVFMGPKPALLYQVFDSGPQAAFDLGFGGIPGLFSVSVPLVGSVLFMELVGVVMIFLGMVFLAIGPAYELIEIHQVLAHTLSYLRIGAVLLAKAGMAFAVNLLFFGAYNEHGHYHFMLTYGPDYVASHYPEATIMFAGMKNMGPAMLAFGILVLIVGHLVVLILGVTSAGIQSVRLEYFEFFSKFYEGGGTDYAPFGHDREFTADE